LESADLIHGFQEIYGFIEYYISGGKFSAGTQYITWVKGSFKFVTLESVKAFVREVIDAGIP